MSDSTWPPPGYLEGKDVTKNSADSAVQIKAQVEKNILWESIYKQEVLDKISVPEEKISEEYNKNKDSFAQPEKVSVEDVAISLSPSEKDAEKVAAEVIKKIGEIGNDSMKLVQDGTFVLMGYEPRKDDDWDKDLYEAAKKLKPGEISGVVKMSDGLHIIKLVEYRSQKVHTFAEVKGSIENKLRIEAQNRKTRECFDELKKGAKIDILVLEAQVTTEHAPK